MGSYLRLLAGMFWRPGQSIREIRARAPFGWAAAAAWLAAIIYVMAINSLYEYAQSGSLRINVSWLLELPAAASSALFLVLFVIFGYVPLVILLAALFARRGEIGRAMREEFTSTSSCALSALAVSLLMTLLPAAIISWQSVRLPPETAVGFLVLSVVIIFPIFAALMTISVEAIFRLGWAAALVVTLLSFLSLPLMPILAQAFSFVCASPFLLIILYFILRGQFSDMVAAQRARSAFKQNLEASTLNPADASAHYNLGLIYQQRGDFDAAEQSFRRAVEIDNRETDAHYQLGRIARERGRLQESLAHFETVIKQDPAHSQHEIWREIARTYLAAGQYADALEMLDRFLARRPSDGEGRYWRGQALASLGRTAEAEEEMKSCIEAVRTSPAYKYRAEQEWLRRAEQYLRARRI